LKLAPGTVTKGNIVTVLCCTPQCFIFTSHCIDFFLQARGESSLGCELFESEALLGHDCDALQLGGRMAHVSVPLVQEIVQIVDLHEQTLRCSTCLCCLTVVVQIM
jgi:hypothetical protein